MQNPEEIKKLARLRLEEATILCENAKYEGAFYLAGYSIELMLKAKICERIGIPNLLSDNSSDGAVREIRKTVQTHDLFVLLVLSGLKVLFDEAKATNKQLFKVSSLLFDRTEKSGQRREKEQWSEKLRYFADINIDKEQVIDLIKNLNDSNGLLTWIDNN